MSITAKQYKKIAKAFIKKGFTPDEANAALKKAGYKVNLKGETLTGVYAMRVMAIMYAELDSKSEALEL